MDVHQIKRKTMKSGKRKSNNSLKVVYISSPVKVKTCASRFRALVQELTGRDSDVSRLTESSDVLRDDHHHRPDSVSPVQSAGDSYRDSPTSSNSLFEFEPLDDVFNSQMAERLEEMFPSSLFNYESFSTSVELDVLGEYGAL